MTDTPYLGRNYVFIVGSPRSGTTIAAETLSRHPDIAYLYEPYYLWNYLVGSGPDDSALPEAFHEKNIAFIRSNAKRFLDHSKARYVIEQSPEESLKLDLIREVLPEARFIHLVRDGYDCIASIRNEWTRRTEDVQTKNPANMVQRVFRTLMRQPMWRLRMMQLAFELRESGLFKPWKWVNKSKWGGRPGWGVRIPGWQVILRQQGQLALNALQWSHVVDQIMTFEHMQPDNTYIDVRYEDLVQSPHAILDQIQTWIGVTPAEDMGGDINAQSLGKGRHAFAPEELNVINPLIQETMGRLGYDIIPQSSKA